MHTNRKKTDDSVHFPVIVHTNRKKTDDSVHFPDFVYTNRKKLLDYAKYIPNTLRSTQWRKWRWFICL